MANKKNQKKVEDKSNAAAKSSSTVEAKKAAAKKAAPAKKASKSKNEKPGMIARAKAYLRSVKSEMKRVVWPSKQELINYSIAVCASLVVVGLVIAALDFVIGEGLILVSGLRG